MKNALVSAVLGLSASALGVAMAQSVQTWIQGMDEGRIQLERAKKELLSIPGVFDEHNKVFSTVGKRAWEDRVKPEFLSILTKRTARETGSPFPSLDDILDWARAHPVEAREILRNLGDLP